MVKRLIFDFGLGHDLTVRGFEPHIGPRADSSEPETTFTFCISLSLSAPPRLYTCSLSLKIIKLKKKKCFGERLHRSTAHSLSYPALLQLCKLQITERCAKCASGSNCLHSYPSGKSPFSSLVTAHVNIPLLQINFCCLDFPFEPVTTSAWVFHLCKIKSLPYVHFGICRLSRNFTFS